MIRPTHPAVLLACLAFVGSPGCAPPPAAPTKPPATKPPADHDHGHDHDDHAHPETLAEGVAALAKVAADVKTHLAAGSRDAADEAVHALAHLLEDLQGLVRKSELAEEGKAAATKALDELFDCFDKLDAALHAKEGEGEPPAEVHASVADRIEAAIKALGEVK